MKTTKNKELEPKDNIKNEEQHNEARLEETNTDSLILENIKNEQFEQYCEFEKRQEETLKKCLMKREVILNGKKQKRRSKE